MKRLLIWLLSFWGEPVKKETKETPQPILGNSKYSFGYVGEQLDWGHMGKFQILTITHAERCNDVNGLSNYYTCEAMDINTGSKVKLGIRK